MTLVPHPPSLDPPLHLPHPVPIYLSSAHFFKFSKCQTANGTEGNPRVISRLTPLILGLVFGQARPGADAVQAPVQTPGTVQRGTATAVRAEVRRLLRTEAGAAAQREREKRGRDEAIRRRETEEWEEERERWVTPWREESEEEEEQEGSWEERGNPYVFEQDHFTSIAETQHGRISVLPNFTKKSKLLRGIENFWLGLLEAEPSTFVAPSHWDSDGILFVVKGRGTITLVRETKRHNLNVEQGDIVRVQAGTPVYMVNRDQNQKLLIAKLLHPVNTPGHYEAFHGTGGQNPKSFYPAFGWGTLEAALKTDRSKLERLFGQQQQGAVVKASRQQIEALSGQEEGGFWPFGGEIRGSKGSRSFRLFRKRPSHCNQYGQMYRVNRDDYSELEDLDVMISFTDITRIYGSMVGPYYNSRAIMISLVTEGEGWLEMVCPHHLSSSSSSTRQHQMDGGRRGHHHQQQGQGKGQRYQKVRAWLRKGTVVVTPAGHPVAAVA